MAYCYSSCAGGGGGLWSICIENIHNQCQERLFIFIFFHFEAKVITSKIWKKQLKPDLNGASAFGIQLAWVTDSSEITAFEL